MDLKQIGLNIKKLRMRIDMTQSQLADKVGKSPNHIAHIESGTAKMSLDTLVDVGKALNASPNEILLGEYPMKKEDMDEFFMETSPYMESDDQLLLSQIADLLATRNQQ